MKETILFENYVKKLMPLPNGLTPDQWILHLEQYVNGEQADRDLLNLFGNICNHLDNPTEISKISTQIFDIIKDQGLVFCGFSKLTDQTSNLRLWFADKVCNFLPTIAISPSLSGILACHINAKWIEHLERFVDDGEIDLKLINHFKDIFNFKGIFNYSNNQKVISVISTKIFDIIKDQGLLLYTLSNPTKLPDQESNLRFWFADKICNFLPHDGMQAAQNRRNGRAIAMALSLSDSLARHINTKNYYMTRQSTPKIVTISLDAQQDGSSLLDNLAAPEMLRENKLLDLLEKNRTLLHQRTVRRTDPKLHYDRFLELMIDPSLPENLTDKIAVIAEVHGVTKAALTAHVYAHFYPFIRNLPS